jgi:hypothetical protein
MNVCVRREAVAFHTLTLRLLHCVHPVRDLRCERRPAAGVFIVFIVEYVP